MKRKLSLLMLLAALVGGVYGFLTPAPGAAQARINVELLINPGGGLMNGSNGWLTCGWHTTCEPPYDTGDALDWDNFDNAWVYWRSYGKRSDSYTGTIANTALVRNDTSYCYRLRQDIVDAFGFAKGSESYMHTRTYDAWNGAVNPVNGGAGYWAFTKFEIGWSVPLRGEKTTNCPFGGSHVHQYSSGFSRNSYPTASQFNSGYREYGIELVGNWQHYVGWCWYC